MITVIYAHPHPLRSRGGRPLLDAVRDAAGRRGAQPVRPLPRFLDRRRDRAARARGEPARGLAAPALLVQRAGAAQALVREGARARLGVRRRRRRAPWQGLPVGRDHRRSARLVLARGAARAPVRGVRAARSPDRALLRHELARRDRGARRAPRRSGRARRRRHADTASGSIATSPRRAVPRARPRDERVLRHRRDDLSRGRGRLRAARRALRPRLGARLPDRRLRDRPVGARPRARRRERSCTSPSSAWC